MNEIIGRDWASIIYANEILWAPMPVIDWMDWDRKTTAVKCSICKSLPQFTFCFSLHIHFIQSVKFYCHSPQSHIHRQLCGCSHLSIPSTILHLRIYPSIWMGLFFNSRAMSDSWPRRGWVSVVLVHMMHVADKIFIDVRFGLFILDSMVNARSRTFQSI